MRNYTSSFDGHPSLFAAIDDDEGEFSHLHATRKPQTRRAGSRRFLPASGQVDRKAWQLCRQVGHTLDEVLAECGDAVLQGLRVESVEPFPDASRLMVTVAFVDGRPGRVPEALRVVNRLEHASGHLRREVATAVTRKRAPMLLYRIAEPLRGTDQ